MSVSRTDRDLVVVLDDAPSPGPGIDLRRHVPRLALEWDRDAPDRRWQQVDATLVFADISGFTALTEKLATRGRIGAEELIETLNRVFGAMLEQAAMRGGELLKFGGDALLFVFRGDDHPFRACRSAVDMRQALKEAAKTPTSVGRLRLSMSVGIHSGPVDFFLVGAPTRELLILGPAATATAEAEHAAVAGEILLTADTAAHLPPRSTAEREDGLHRLRWRFTYPPEGEGPPTPMVTHDELLTLFPVALGEYLDDAVPDPEHKVATIGFARFSDTDTMLREQGHAAVADALHGTVSVVEDALIAEGVTLLATDLDSDGGKLFMGSGVPYSSEDDEGRMLRAMRRVLDVGTPLPMQIGVNRGHVFAAEVGTPNRAAYSAMGDTTNTAARIMSKAPAGVLFAHPTVLEQSRTLFATEPAGPFPMKGKAVPVLVHAVGGEVGTRDAGHDLSGELVGRDDELTRLRDLLGRGLAGEGAVVTVAAATGLGKSRLVREALDGVGATIVTVRAEPYGMSSPYRMLRDPVRTAFGVQRDEPDQMAAQLIDTTRRIMPDLLPLVPLLTDVVQVPFAQTPEANAIEPKFRPERIADMLVRLIEATVPGPFVLLVEEAHWADSASIAVLRRVADAVEGRPWAVIVARRDEGEGFDPERAERVVLEPLPSDVMRRFALDVTADAPLREHEIDGLVSRAQGNPLFLQELVRVFREVGSLDDVPESLHAALDAQIDALDPHSRRVLRYSAVLGRSFRREVLDETLRQEDLVVDASTLDRIATFVEQDGRERLRFRNSMIRDAAYNGLAFRLRARLHRAAGRAVEKISTDLEADADTLALHYWQAGDSPKTWVYARMAGDRAARAYSNIDAATQYQRAVDVGRRMRLSDLELRTVLTRLSDVRFLGGLIDDSLDALRSAARLCGDDRLARASLFEKSAAVRLRAGAQSRALSDITKGLALLAEDPTPEARRFAVRLKVLRLSIYAEQNKLERVVAESPPLVQEARAARDPEPLAEVLTMHDMCSLQLGDLSVGDYLTEALALANEANQPRWALRAYYALAGLRLYRGEWDGAASAWDAARTAASQTGDSINTAIVGVNQGELLVQIGRLDEAAGVLDESIRVLHVSGATLFETYGELQRGRLLLARDDLEQAASELAAVEVEGRKVGHDAIYVDAALARAEALSRLGRPADALAALVVIAGESPSDVVLVARRHREQGRALLGLGRLDEALEALEAGVESARSYKLPYEEGQLLAVLAAAREAQGDAAAAAALRTESADMLARVGVR